MGNKTDKRTIETKNKLKNCLADILSEKELSKITIRELSEKASIHRATFYDHYEDIYALYDDLLCTIFDEMTFSLTSEHIITYEDFYKAIVEFISNNPSMSIMVFSSNIIITKMSNFFLDGCIKIWIKENPNIKITSELKYFSYFRVSGVISLLKHWVLDDFSHSKSDVLKYILNIDSSIDQFMINNHS